ncbi:unnamed protein product, partial [Prorocentrum cordatum]
MSATAGGLPRQAGVCTGERKSASKLMMCATAVAEPPDDQVVDLLEALPDGERQCYTDERGVLDNSGKSGAIFEELEERFAFVGGSTSECARYLMRGDLPKDTWTLETPRRGGHGMHGGAAMASMRAPTDEWGAASFDEDTAFTRPRAPAWMAKWQACPPLRACWVWGELGQRIRDLVAPAGWVAPRYHRLAMGDSHSVHLLRTVNAAIIGRALLGVGARLAAPKGAAAPADAAADGAPRASPPEGGGLEGVARAGGAPERGQRRRYDDDWIMQQSSCRAEPPSLGGYSVADWIEAVK